MILFQTNPFWITLLSFCINAEPIIPLEMVGMVICFAGVVVISLNNQRDQDADPQGITVDAATNSTATPSMEQTQEQYEQEIDNRM